MRYYSVMLMWKARDSSHFPHTGLQGSLFNHPRKSISSLRDLNKKKHSLIQTLYDHIHLSVILNPSLFLSSVPPPSCLLLISHIHPFVSILSVSVPHHFMPECISMADSCQYMAMYGKTTTIL